MSIGETLTAARLAAGLTTADVAEKTRIRRTLIEAIEILRVLTGLSYEAFLFSFWFITTQPDVILDGPLKQEVQARNRLLSGIADMSDRNVYAALLRLPAPAGL